MEKDGEDETGGGREIRTLGTLSSTTVFKTGAFNRSAIPPLTSLSNQFLDTVCGFFAGYWTAIVSF